MDKSWGNINEIVLFGFGRQGRKLLKILEKDFHIVAIVDNNTSIQGELIHDGMVVLSLSEALQIIKEKKTIVCAMGNNYCQIRNQLLNIGLEEGLDFLQHEVFINHWYQEYRHEMYMMKTDIFITSHCNLKCKYCASFIPYWDKPLHIDLENIIQTVDLYFQHVAYVFSMDLFGGEPLLYPDICKLIDYIGKNYRDRIGYFGVITNALVKPRDELLNIMNRYNLQFSISDYSHIIACEEHVDSFCSILKEHGICYTRNRNLEWKDLGFPKKIRNRSSQQSKAHRLLCNTTCHVLYNKKLYFCAVGVAGEIMSNGASMGDEKDSISLEKSKSELSAEQISEFSSGVVKGEYCGFCSVCDGYGSDNSAVVMAAEQIKAYGNTVQYV